MATASTARTGLLGRYPSWAWPVGALVISAVLVAAWFPFGSWSHQRAALSAASSQLSKLKSETKALQHEQVRLKDPRELARIAREQYQLVNPGDRVVQVLPPTASQSSLATGKQPFAGDPGLKPPVAPSAAGLLGDGTQATEVQPNAAPKAPAPANEPPSQGFVQRVLRTLEFWR